MKLKACFIIIMLRKEGILCTDSFLDSFFKSFINCEDMNRVIE